MVAALVCNTRIRIKLFHHSEQGHTITCNHIYKHRHICRHIDTSSFGEGNKTLEFISKHLIMNHEVEDSNLPLA